MRVCCLSSGSKGNLIYIDNDEYAILIDNGLSLIEAEKRLEIKNLNPDKIKGILISHEHSDHIKGITKFANKYNCIVAGHISSWSQLNKHITIPNNNKLVFTEEKFDFFSFLITPIPVSHDSSFCVGYSIEHNGQKISILTDLGHFTNNCLTSVSGSDIMILESNHDEEMLVSNPKYPLILKRRILSDHGHLSNLSCAEALLEIAKNGTRQFILAHLSESNNTPDIAYKTNCDYLSNFGIIEGVDLFIDVATQNIPTKIFEIS